MATIYPDVSSLSDKELLSLTLRENPCGSVIDELTNRFTSLRDLAGVTFIELTEIKGIGQVRASALLACIELARRLYSYSSTKPVVISSPQDVSGLVMNDMRFLDREHFQVILLNTKNHVIRLETVSIGTLNSTSVHPREIFKLAVKYSAAAIILVHNHPSGDPAPSKDDLEVTKRLVEVGKVLGIDVLDHIVIGDGKFVSFKEKGLF